MFNTKFIQIAGWSVLCLTVSFAGCSEKAGIPSGYDIPAEAAVQIEALSVADTDCGFDFIWSFDDRVSVAAGAGGAVAAAGSGVVIAGLRVLAVGAQADDAGDALQQGVELVFGVVVAEHVLVFHNLLVHGPELVV